MAAELRPRCGQMIDALKELNRITPPQPPARLGTRNRRFGELIYL